MGRIVAISNQKGGVGKTTTAINLAASLAVAERPTLLVDVDPQANAGSGLGVSGEESLLYRALMGEADLKDGIRATALPYLHVLPAGPDLVGVEVELVGAERREVRLRDALRPLAESYDFVLIDCPPSLGLLTLNALTAADGVIVPMQCEYFALEGLSRLVDTIERIRGSLNPLLDIDGIVFTMFDPRNNLAHSVVGEVRGHFGDRVYRTAIPRNVRLSESPSHGKPALLYDAASRGAQSYLALAQEILERPAVLQTAS